MSINHQWQKEPEARLQGSRELDRSKLQGPCIVRIPSGGYRLYYTAVGPAKPFPTCQGYILSATSQDGLVFRTEPGIGLAPLPELPHMSLRVLVPTVTPCDDGRWRMYFESRGTADQPTVICSAVSSDMLHWEYEDGIRLSGEESVRGPRYLKLPDGRGRLYCCGTDSAGLTKPAEHAQGVISAITSDGLRFELEPGFRMRGRQAEYDSGGITAAQVIAPRAKGDRWSMVYSAWEDVPTGSEVPLHPSADSDAMANGRSEDFAAASIAVDMAGYRSRVLVAHSNDGMDWGGTQCVIEGTGYGGDGLDAVHAEDMSVISIGDDRYRMYYAACDTQGVWRIASAVTRA